MAINDTYDLVAIGAGPAGESAAELAAFFGHRSAVIEKARPGGTVTTTGGAPTKTLREAALYFSGFCQGDIYGLLISTPPEIATGIRIGTVLRAGVIASSLALAVGLLLQLMNAPGAQLLLNAGILTLLATPVARVVVSIVGYIRARDWTFSTLTAIVLLELLASAVAALVFKKL